MTNSSKMAGFTIIELMITLVVAAILLSVAAPSFRAIIQENRLTTDINTLAASLNLTRSEAITRGIPATLCKSNNTTSCVATANWHDGWIVFDESNDAGTIGTIDAGETIIRVVNGLSVDTTLEFEVGNNDIVYNPTGFTDSADAGKFKFCDDRNIPRGLDVSASGRVRTVTAADLPGCP
jgi:type IV fimbrial biogenesis protein FimT